VDTAAWEVARGLVVPAVLGTLAYLLISTVGRFFGRFEKLQPMTSGRPSPRQLSRQKGVVPRLLACSRVAGSVSGLLSSKILSLPAAR